jgi:hypothetical protein
VISDQMHSKEEKKKLLPLKENELTLKWKTEKNTHVTWKQQYTTASLSMKMSLIIVYEANLISKKKKM